MTDLLTPGATLGARWQVHRVMRGGLGAVLVVYDARTREVQAAKTFLQASEDTVERFRQEAYAWIQLGRHPHLVEALSFEIIGGRPFLFLEFVPGGDLAAWIGSPVLTLRKTLEFAFGFCDGMLHAYAHGLTAHRDVKPANCLISGDGRLKITDFGLARVHADEGLRKQRQKGRWGMWLASKMAGPAPNSKVSLTGTGEGLGTCTHMAPEQFRDAAAVDTRADIYAFGVMLYEMLSGQLPFGGNNFFGFAYQHCHVQAPPLPGDFDSDLRGLVARCLAKDPGERPQSFQEVRRALETVFRRATGEPPPEPIAGPQADALDLNDQGAGLMNLGLYAEAEEKLMRALELQPELVPAWVNRAILLDRQGKHEEGLKHLRHAATLEPHTATFDQLGVALSRLGRDEEAYQAFKRSLHLDPRSHLTYHNMGLHLAARGRHEQAQAAFDRALEFFPRMEQAWLGKGMSLFNAGDLEGCHRCLERAVAINTNFTGGWVRLADVCLTLGHLDQAQAAAARALELNPELGEAWLQHARVLVSRGDYQAALDPLNRALVLDPEQSLGWYVLGSSLALLDRYVEAVSAFDRALALDPEDAGAAFNRGVALLKCGQREAGVAGLKRAASLGSPEAHQVLAQIGH